MRRTQLYLDDDLWNALHARARSLGTSISDLVRQAARERYLGKLDERREAMQALVGIRKDSPGIADSTEYVRRLRRGTRTERLGNNTRKIK
jgi:Ribbon-helix-helix protein, copG family